MYSLIIRAAAAVSVRQKHCCIGDNVSSLTLVFPPSHQNSILIPYVYFYNNPPTSKNGEITYKNDPGCEGRLSLAIDALKNKKKPTVYAIQRAYMTFLKQLYDGASKVPNLHTKQASHAAY